MVNILTLPLGAYQTNCYLVWGEGSDRCVIIDPGYESEEIWKQAQGKTVEAILLTHGHFDHVGGVNALADKTGCPVYLHHADLSIPAQLTLPLCQTEHYGDGDVLTLAGLSFRVLHTPGHTNGSVCLLTEDCIFSGDTLFAGSCGRTDLGGDWATILQSLNRLKNLHGDYRVYPGHSDATTLEEERLYNPYIQ